MATNAEFLSRIRELLHDEVPAPSGLSLAVLSQEGELMASFIYGVKVTVLGESGESLPTAEAQLTYEGGQSSTWGVQVTIPRVAAARGYRVYARRTDQGAAFALQAELAPAQTPTVVYKLLALAAGTTPPTESTASNYLSAEAYQRCLDAALLELADQLGLGTLVVGDVEARYEETLVYLAGVRACLRVAVRYAHQAKTAAGADTVDYKQKSMDFRGLAKTFREEAYRTLGNTSMGGKPGGVSAVATWQEDTLVNPEDLGWV